MSNSKFKVEFTLKQHTPIIHFQSDQNGATLRATELKPKFDRFLLENVKDLPYKENANKAKYLDYKVKIVASPIPRSDIDDRDPLFFGNMKPKEMSDEEFERKKKYFVKNETIKIEFISFEPKIKEAIDKHFKAFLSQTNFGTRQSKGFGSFFIFDETTKKNEPFDINLIPYKVYSFNSNNWKNDIKTLYSFLRQGINLPRGKEVFYSKPAIFTFAIKNNWTWDKKAIKQHFFPNDLKADKNKYSDPSGPIQYTGHRSYLLRDIFGLSSEQTWMSYNKAIIKKEDTQTNDDRKIERFKSPLTFKVIDNQVFFWADKSYETILNKTFKISTRGNKPLELSTPSTFSFDEFFEYVKTIDLSRHIAQKYHSTKTYKDIARILNGIKASK